MTKHIDLILDSGNSYFKIAGIKKNNLESIIRIPKNEFDNLKQIIRGKNIIISNVGTDDIFEVLKQECNSVFILDNSCKFPFQTNYRTTQTWGMDRACNVAAAQYLYPNRNVLIIDIGTCLKFDLIDVNSVYQGGTISPGIRLRFKSLNNYTAKLPLIEPNKDYSLIGKSTDESILYGVMQGFKLEIEGLIENYRNQYKDLLIILTGGDLIYFDFSNKSNIFAVENLTLLGLYQLFLFNED